MSAAEGYRLILIDRHQRTASWTVKPVVAWGLFADDEHDLDGKPGHWERVTALWQHEDPSFPNLSWERDDEAYSPVWLVLGPDQPVPADSAISAEWRKRHEAWQKDLQLRQKDKAAVLAHAREVRDSCAKMLANAEEQLRTAERDAEA
jgi:hypothetical protein